MSEDNFASVAETTIQRDGDGEIQSKIVRNAITVYVDGDQKKRDVKIIPTTYGDAVTKFGDAGEVSNVQAETIADLINDHLVAPDYTEHPECPDGYVSAEFVEENMPPFLPAEILQAIMKGSGVPLESVTADGEGGANVRMGN